MILESLGNTPATSSPIFDVLITNFYSKTKATINFISFSILVRHSCSNCYVMYIILTACVHE